MFTHLLLRPATPEVLLRGDTVCIKEMCFWHELFWAGNKPIIKIRRVPCTRICVCTEGSTVINYYAYLEVEDGLPPSYLGTTCKIAYLVAL